MTFLTRCSPTEAGRLIAHRRHPDQATLMTIDVAYGEGSAVTWLKPRLLLVSERAGVKEKMDEAQITEAAQAIVRNWSFLSLGDVDRFLQRLRDGAYGTFYGMVDPMLILERLRTRFLRERDMEIAEMEREQRQAERERERDKVMTPQEFCRSMGYPECTSILELMKILNTPSAE